MKDPIDCIRWRHFSELTANHYNPNVVFNPELRLIERSIIVNGWIQPILATPAGTIIDGFHRWKLVQDSVDLQRKYGGLVPVAELDIDEGEARILTVRMNRAKGTHVALRMSELVKDLVEKHNFTEERICLELGATPDEVRLLYQNSLWKARGLDSYRYGPEWVPRETRIHGPKPE